MFRSKAIPVEVTPTLIVHPLHGTTNVQQLYVVYNTSATQTVYLGGDDVSTTNGLPLKPEQYMTIPLVVHEQLFAVAAGGPELRVAGTRQEQVVS